MTIKDFLLLQGNKIVTRFDDIRIRLSYNELSDIHFMEFHPQSLYNDDVKLCLSYILDDFYELFPEDSLSFVTESDSINSYPDDVWIQGSKLRLDWNVWLEKSSAEFLVEPVYSDDMYFIAA